MYKVNNVWTKEHFKFIPIKSRDYPIPIFLYIQIWKSSYIFTLSHTHIVTEDFRCGPFTKVFHMNVASNKYYFGKHFILLPLIWVLWVLPNVKPKKWCLWYSLMITCFHFSWISRLYRKKRLFEPKIFTLDLLAERQRFPLSVNRVHRDDWMRFLCIFRTTNLCFPLSPWMMNQALI